MRLAGVSCAPRCSPRRGAGRCERSVMTLTIASAPMAARATRAVLLISRLSTYALASALPPASSPLRSAGASLGGTPRRADSRSAGWPASDSCPSCRPSGCADGRAEDIRVVPVVVTEREFVEVEREILLRNLVVRADHAALEERPEAIEVRGMDVPTDVLAGRVVHALVFRVRAVVRVRVLLVVVGRDERHLVGDRLAHERFDPRLAEPVLHHLRDHVALAGN